MLELSSVRESPNVTKELSYVMLELGMVMGGVWAGFFSTQIQPTGQDLLPGPGPFTKRIFFRGTDSPPPSPVGSTGPIGPWYFRAHSVAQKKKCLPDIDFLSNQIGGEKEHSRKPIIFSATNRLETLFFHYNIFPHQK